MQETMDFGFLYRHTIPLLYLSPSPEGARTPTQGAGTSDARCSSCHWAPRDAPLPA
uniref:Uncharacterized protein n=1 Tax=Chrysemys picta bellii TaxID=8478 RepID=A0A8C3F7N5_CHRPI